MRHRALSSQFYRGDAVSVASRIERCLSECLSPITAESLVVWMCRKLGVDAAALDTLNANTLVTMLDQALSLYLTDGQKQKALTSIRFSLNVRSQPVAQSVGMTIVVAEEKDVALARATALRVALSAGLVKPDAVKVSTVVSELTRNMLQYAGAGRVEIRALAEPKPAVQIVASDRGPGIANVQQILDGKYRSQTGMGVGLIGSRRLMDSFDVASEPGRGTTITAVKFV